MYSARLRAFEREYLSNVLASLDERNLPAFEGAFRVATDAANQNHVELGYAFIRWKIPERPPGDLEVGLITDSGPVFGAGPS
jgi:hypothetical protein